MSTASGSGIEEKAAGYAQVVLFGACHGLEIVSCPPISPVQDRKMVGGN